MRPVEDDPRRFLTTFRGSSSYQTAFEHFFRDKRLTGDVTEHEKREAFEQSDVAKVALVEYARREQPFSFSPSSFADDTARAILDYAAHVRHIRQRMAERPDAEEIGAMDWTRSLYHVRAAEAMVREGIAPNVKLGRTLARLILVDLHLDTYESALQMV